MWYDKLGINFVKNLWHVLCSRSVSCTYTSFLLTSASVHFCIVSKNRNKKCNTNQVQLQIVAIRKLIFPFQSGCTNFSCLITSLPNEKKKRSPRKRQTYYFSMLNIMYLRKLAFTKAFWTTKIFFCCGSRIHLRQMNLELPDLYWLQKVSLKFSWRQVKRIWRRMNGRRCLVCKQVNDIHDKRSACVITHLVAGVFLLLENYKIQSYNSIQNSICRITTL